MKTLLKYFVLVLCLNFIEGAFRCDYKHSVAAKGWFKYHVVPATWFDARLRCALEGAALVSPTTLEIQSEMINIINKSTLKQEIFTGIHASLSQGDYYTVEGTPLSSIPLVWAANEPDNKANKESCITFNRNGELADRPCEDTRPYVCYRPESPIVQANECGTVDQEYHLDTRTNKCYKFHRQDPTGGKNVTFIGFHNWGERVEWRTVHGQTLNEAGYNIFYPGEPNGEDNGEFCGCIFRSGLLCNIWCDKEFTFICEKSPSYPGVCHEANVPSG
ncbi:hypothetical protein PYW08_009552 [Mythimna loreyi]|uniref:Uncharacterized protein n=1 Tax=Mythimna loreyi TaxID=667449 RepID=A0ACC2Q7F6_9NEOP|nr:hypothetical protein PYW08_009552 [Mythimna loreyi]